jgi:chemotaxis protein MotB
MDDLEPANAETESVRQALETIAGQHKSELDVFLTVERTQEGLLIKLGDRSREGMFAVGSVKPGAALIALVGDIGKLLSSKSGEVIVSGHTDSRPFKRGTRDNWQLSSQRAQVASYMLMRGGLPESRIRKVEGHGSASPLDRNDPSADANRRVEFLLRDEQKP